MASLNFREQKRPAGAQEYHVVAAANSEYSHEIAPRSARMGGRTSDILYAFSLMTIPLTAFTAVLLALIFHYRVVPNDFLYENLKLPNQTLDSRSIYAKISATTLTTVASWSSTVAPILVGCAVSLISYPVSRRLLRASESGMTGELPTPFQLSVMLKMITSGSPGALWQWFQYSWGWRGKKESQGRPMKIMTTILTLGIILSTFVFATDTWFHLKTKAVLLTQVHVNTGPSLQSFGLIPDCYDVESPWAGGCTLNPAGTAVFLQNGSFALQVLSNLSNTAQISTVTQGPDTFVYVGQPAPARLETVDYTASTWGARTQCVPTTTQCVDEDSISGVGFRYKCPFALEGYLNTPRQNVMSMAYFTDKDSQNNQTTSVSLPNPYYFAAVVAVNQNFGHGPALMVAKDPEVTSTTHGADVFAVHCNTTVYDVQYSMFNGTVTRFSAQPSNSTLANIVQGAQQYSHVGDPNILQGASIAALIGPTAQDIADYFALTYSQVALSLATIAFAPQPAIESQVREDMIVARIPIVPLACLLLANILLVLLGIILTIVAFATGRGETREIQARLSIPAVVAALFEGSRASAALETVEDAFEERRGVAGPRVGLTRSDVGGWRFSVWQPH